MKRDKTGYEVVVSTAGEQCKAFVPAPLPPDPPLDIAPDLQEKIDRALLALGRLDSVATILPDTSLFLYMFVRKEAVLSSQIEGAQSSLADLLTYEADGVPGVPLDDVQEVSNYVAAMNHGMLRLKEDFPMSLRLIREIHGELLSKGRGSAKTPGEFRRTQNWIGGTRPGNAAFVPPPPERIMECMGDLEKFIHDKPKKTPTLIKAALTHVQYETIHPFLDGNGRVGRLLVTLMLCNEGIIQEPMLYLSLYFKAHRQEYYGLLNKVRKTGDWEKWLAFFMTAIVETADQGVAMARTLAALADENRNKIKTLGKAAPSALRVHQALLQTPVLSVGKASEMTGLWFSSLSTAFKRLEELGIAKEITGGKRNRLFAYDRYIKLLSDSNIAGVR